MHIHVDFMKLLFGLRPQEAQGAEGLSMLSGLGVTGAAHAVLQLHSVLANGKRRVTAEFCQAAQEGSAAALRLHRVSTMPRWDNCRGSLQLNVSFFCRS